MFLREELQQKQHFLLMVLEWKPDPDGITMYSRKLRDLSYDIEDSVDALVRLPSSRRNPHRSRSFIGRILRAWNFSNKLQGFKSRFKELSDLMRDRYSYSYRGAPPKRRFVPVAADPLIPPVVRDVKLVGVDDPRDYLAELLLKGHKREVDPELVTWHRVLSTVGSAGLGKTTLAKQVFCKIQAHFDCLAWVSMSPSRTMRCIMKDLFCQVEGCSGANIKPDIIGSFKEYLEHKRYLVVLDGIWHPDAWGTVEYALPFNCLGSRVITTTRFDDVAELCSKRWDNHIYYVKPLGIDDSLTMFHGTIFGSEANCPPALVDIADKILDKCTGFPIAVAALSGLLAYKPHTRSAWERVYNSIDASSPWDIEGMKRIISLCYYGLPRHLKVSFLHLSIFPEDYPIDHGRLLRSWIAEGFILEKPGQTVEEIAETYLNELINRHLILPISNDSDDCKIGASLICGMVYDLIKTKAVEENFVTFLGDKRRSDGVHSTVCRLSMMNLKGNHEASMTTSHVRSLYIFGGSGINLSFERFPFLRVLDLEGCKELKNHHVEEIARLLLNLRYLSIRDTPISEIPDQISQLQHLTTLDLRGTEVEELPMSVARLERLAYLLCDKMKFPKWIGQMELLSCLSQFDISQS